MRFSQGFFPTLKEVPSEAETISHQLMIRAGLIRKVSGGIYDWLPLGLRVLKKVEQIVREELNRAAGQEVWLPVVQPRELWEETGRWQVYGKELLRFKDRKGAEFCLAPTAEELITDLVRRDVRSYRPLPILLYQFGTKFRDEIRPRFGVMRAREFYMMDAYSFHADEADAERTYERVFKAYEKIFTRCGFRFRPVEAETGAIGGSFSHEFMVLASTGEEVIASCSGCAYAANVERAEIHPNALRPVAGRAPSGSTPLTVLSLSKNPEPPVPLKEVPTPNAWSVEAVAELLKLPKDRFIKTLFYLADGKVAVALVRGDHELNEAKLQRFLGAKILERADRESYEKSAGCAVGFAGPVGLKARMIADHAVRAVLNGVSGANRADTHLMNINPGRDFQPEAYADLRRAGPGDRCAKCGKELEFSRGIEVGHTFKLGTKYSDSMKAFFLDEGGKERPFVMGCYGIGVSRVSAACIEQCHDEAGILWPVPLAPYTVLILPVNMSHPGTREAAEKIYADAQRQGLEALLDDRDERAGIKFKDADLLGIPYRVTIGEKNLAEGKVELKARHEKDPLRIPVMEVVRELCRRLSLLKA